MAPAFVWQVREVIGKERTPHRFFRFLDQLHAGLAGSFIALDRVALCTTADDIGPNSPASLIAGNNMIDIEIFAIELFATVLANVVVPIIDVAACQPHLVGADPVVIVQPHDPRNQQDQARRVNPLMLLAVLEQLLVLRKLGPGCKVVIIVPLVLHSDDFRNTVDEHDEGTLGVCDIDGTVILIEHQHAGVEHVHHGRHSMRFIP